MATNDERSRFAWVRRPCFTCSLDSCNCWNCIGGIRIVWLAAAVEPVTLLGLVSMSACASRSPCCARGSKSINLDQMYRLLNNLTALGLVCWRTKPERGAGREVVRESPRCKKVFRFEHKYTHRLGLRRIILQYRSTFSSVHLVFVSLSQPSHRPLSFQSRWFSLLPRHPHAAPSFGVLSPPRFRPRRF